MKKIIIILSGFLLMSAFAISVSAAPDPNDLVGWWKFEEGSGITTHDSSGNNNDGILINNPTWSNDGKFGKALSFDGAHDYVNAGSDSSFDFTGGKFTVEAWINGNTFQTGYYDLIVFRGYSNWAFGVFRGDRLMFGETAWNSLWSRHIYSDPLSWETDKWYHIAVVYDTVGKTADFYRDGVLVGDGKQSTDEFGITDSGDVTINYPHSVSFNGIIDEVRIWNRAIDPSEFYIDGDGDKVYGEEDLCPGTEADEWDENWGTNRWQVMDDTESFRWYQNKPKAGVTPRYDLDYTYGCSCEQILGKMVLATGFDFGGHYKFGCSKSILEDWNAGIYYIGDELESQEIIEVPANDADGVLSSMTLALGTDYVLKAYGTAMACSSGSCFITFDPEYSTSDGTTWVDGVAAPYDTYGLDLLDLKVDGGFVDWGVYNGFARISN